MGFHRRQLEDSGMRMHHPAASARLAALGTLVLILAACGAGTATPATTPQAARFPITVTSSGGSTVTLAKQPRRIVSLSATATEMLFAINAGSQVVAVDDQSNYPSSAPMTKLSGYQPNIEAIAGYAPDLVVASDDQGSLVHGMQTLNIPILLEPAAKTLDDSYQQILQLGQVTGHSSDAETVVKNMKTKVSAFLSLVSKPARQLTVYHELDDNYYSATSTTFIGQVYKLLGLKNIADTAKGAANGYPQLSAEYIVSSNPDLIVLADTKCCKQDLSTIAARPGWSVIAAVRSGNVVNVDDDIASRWGPRVIDFMQAIAPRVEQLEKQAA
jgi:cobalamin transport system substrate-binding protein